MLIWKLQYLKYFDKTTQVRLCKEDCPPAQRVEAAETLAFLTEVDMELQRLASISNHLIPTLAGLLRGMPLASDHKLSQDMKQAAFRVSATHKPI